MPQREPALLCLDILRAARHIQSHLGAVTREEFSSDQMRRDAVERCLIVVGEALNQARQQWPDLTGRITSAQRIVDFRNIMVHGYAMIEPEVVWDIVRVHLPILLAEARTL